LPTKHDEARPVVEEGVEGSTLDTLLEEHQARSESRSSAPADLPAGGLVGGPVCVMGECIDARHPTLQGRVLVRWQARDGHVQQRWLPTLQGLPVRQADRVLMLRPEGSDELVVTGVVDGFAQRPVPERSSAAVIELARDEAVRLLGTDGKPLLELHQGESGPVLTVLHDDLEIAAPGRLRLRGKHVQVQAEQGPVDVHATGDVVLRGEVIKLN
jgi:hypothetical protein